MSAIKAVFFDIDGTLYPIKGLNRQFARLYFFHPIRTVLFFKARKAVREVLKSTGDGSTTRDVFLHRQAQSVGKNGTYFNPIYQDIVKKRKIAPYKGLVQLLENLKNHNYMLGVLSDFPVENKLKELGLDGYFTYCLSSEDCGYLKPDKRAFDYILRVCGYKCNEVLYIGDSLTKDYNGALNAGMSAVLVDGSSDKGFPVKDVYGILDISPTGTNDL